MSEKKGTLFSHEDFNREVKQPATDTSELRKRIEIVEGDIIGLRSGMHHNYEKINALEGNREPQSERISVASVLPSRWQRLSHAFLYKLYSIELYKLVPLLLLTVVASLCIGYFLAYQYLTYLYQIP